MDYFPSVRVSNVLESYHQLRRAVAYANFGKLRFKMEHELQIWGECSRLITNCIIFYNALLLSRLLQYAEYKGDEEALAVLKRVSPVAWQHINFYGRRSNGFGELAFSKSPAPPLPRSK